MTLADKYVDSIQISRKNDDSLDLTMCNVDNLNLKYAITGKKRN